MIHITPFAESDFAGGVEADTYFANFGYVSNIYIGKQRLNSEEEFMLIARRRWSIYRVVFVAVLGIMFICGMPSIGAVSPERDIKTTLFIDGEVILHCKFRSVAIGDKIWTEAHPTEDAESYYKIRKDFLDTFYIAGRYWLGLNRCDGNGSHCEIKDDRFVAQWSSGIVDSQKNQIVILGHWYWNFDLDTGEMDSTRTSEERGRVGMRGFEAHGQCSISRDPAVR
jgi:hypothetical protein